MPQNINSVWKADLGSDYKQVHNDWCHTIGNLTLTCFNSEMSDSSFAKKRDTYVKSNFQLSRDAVDGVLQWNEKTIIKRANRLAKFASQIWQLPSKYNYPITNDEIDYLSEFDIMDEVKITSQKPKSYIFQGVEKSVDSWRDLFVGILTDLYDYDHDTYRKFIHHEVTQSRHLAEPIGSSYKFRTKDPAEICPGFKTELNFSAQDIMLFLQIAVQEIYALQGEVKYTLKPKTRKS
jgi:hypothetical protein